MHAPLARVRNEIAMLLLEPAGICAGTCSECVHCWRLLATALLSEFWNLPESVPEPAQNVRTYGLLALICITRMRVLFHTCL